MSFSWPNIDRWAEPLAETFPRILAQNLSHLLCTKAIFLYPWKYSVKYDYRIDIEIIRMDGTLGEGTAVGSMVVHHPKH